MEEISSFGLVSRTFTPARGRFSYQAKSSARAQTFPTTMMAGVWTVWAAQTASSVPRVATIRCWAAVVPRSSTAAGMSGSIPAARRPPQISPRAAMPMRNTSVPFVRTRASKSIS